MVAQQGPSDADACFFRGDNSLTAYGRINATLSPIAMELCGRWRVLVALGRRLVGFLTLRPRPADSMFGDGEETMPA